MKDYQKILLYLYPKLHRLIRCAGEVVEGRAVASGRETDTEACIERLLKLIGFRNALLYLSGELEAVLAHLTREEAYLLEYKYFRRKKKLEGEFAAMQLNCSERTYFRRQARLESKLNALFMRRGMDEEWFMRVLGGFPYIRDALARIQAKGAGAFAEKRFRGAPAHRPMKKAPEYQKTSSASS